MNRRELLQSSACAAGLALCGCASRERIALDLGVERVPLPPDFIGLGYEMSSVSGGALLSPANSEYVRLVAGLGSQGVIRIGGIVADYTRYVPAGQSASDPHATVVTRRDIEALNGFLQRVGWRAIWSFNFAQGTVADAVESAHALAEILGERLLAIELGNEVDNYGSSEHPFRRAPYTYETYRAEYSQWRSALLEVVPGIRFAAPDVAYALDWVERMAADAKGDVQLLTAHYYRGWEKQGSQEQLLNPDPKLRAALNRLGKASKASGIPWRMCEANSFWGGGLRNVSDTFVGALWTLDFILLLAGHGCAGVNLQTGFNQLGFLSWYSPIRNEPNGKAHAGVPYYGMLAFAEARRSCDEVGILETTHAWRGITGYVLGSPGKTRSVVLINRSSGDFDVSLGGTDLAQCQVSRLMAPSPQSTDGVTFAAAAVAEDGRWAPARLESAQAQAVRVPAMSAAVLRA